MGLVEMSKPNLFIIGAPKAGTTAFVNGLSQHSDIFVPSCKEPRFFDAHVYFDNSKDYPIKNIDDYLKIYSSESAAAAKYRVDGSVFNMYSLDSIRQILELSSDAKFIVILRDPITAVKSMFAQRMKYIDLHMREVSDNFEDCWRLLKARRKGKGYPDGCRNSILFRYDLLYSYEKYIPGIVDIVGKQNLHIESYETFRDDPQSFYGRIVEFLDLEGSWMPENKKINTSYFVEKTFASILWYKIVSTTRKIGIINSLKGIIPTCIRSFMIQGVNGLVVKKKAVFFDQNKYLDKEIRKFFSATYSYLDKLLLP